MVGTGNESHTCTYLICSQRIILHHQIEHPVDGIYKEVFYGQKRASHFRKTPSLRMQPIVLFILLTYFSGHSLSKCFHQQINEWVGQGLFCEVLYICHERLVVD